jgi:group I intron endonuclease
MQHAWNKYGEDSFVFETLLYCASEDCIMYEQIYLDVYKPEYNMCKTAGSQLGYRHTDETKQKMSRAHMGKTLSNEHKTKISNALRGKLHSGQFKPGDAAFTGRKHSEESKYKMSESRKEYWRKKHDK